LYGTTTEYQALLSSMCLYNWQKYYRRQGIICYPKRLIDCVRFLDLTFLNERVKTAETMKFQWK
jgi:hypothetical protein